MTGPATPLGTRLYEELHGLAAGYLRGERAGHTLQPTALVHEAWIRLADDLAVESEAHFRALAARAMRRVLVDHARARGRVKRGGGRERLPLTSGLAPSPGRALDVLALEEALEALAALDERRARVVELRFYGGLSVADVAEVLGRSPKTVEADWAFARAWLHARLDGA